MGEKAVNLEDASSQMPPVAADAFFQLVHTPTFLSQFRSLYAWGKSVSIRRSALFLGALDDALRPQAAAAGGRAVAEAVFLV